MICNHKNEMVKKFAAHPLTLLSSMPNAMRETLHDMQGGKMHERVIDFIELQFVAEFFEYDEILKRFEGKKQVWAQLFQQ